MSWINLPAGYSPPVSRAVLREPRAWYEFRDQGEDEAELLIFSEIGWWGVLADEFVEQLNAVTARKLTVRVNSPGGSVFQGIAIGNALRAHPASVTVRVEGLAASIASVIALAGDRLVMAPSSMFMIHDASTATWGDAAEMRKTADILDKISDNIADAYAAKAGGTRAEWRDRMLAETWYTADEAVEVGLADELMVPPKTDEPDGPDDAATRMAAAWDLSVFRYAGRAAAPPPSPPESSAGERAITDQASAPPPRIPAAAAPLVPAETSPPEPAPAPTAAAAAIDADVDQRPAVGPEPAAPLAPDPWADLVAHLLTPADPSADDLLAHLREA
ncbi:head maturation protease, ClpP-related [Nonomuraea angiospora]